MLTTKNKSVKSGNRNSPLDPSKRSGEKSKSGQKEKIVYPQESEITNQREGVDSTFTERNDVTPPNKKEFPSVGPAKTDFASRRQGRTTGRMIGHEPGTEAI